MAIAKRRSATYEGDPLIPIMNLVCMLIPLLLYGAVFVRFTTLTVSPPPIDPGNKPPEVEREDLDLTVMITDQGFHFRVNPRFREPWMASAGGTASIGPDIPKGDGGWDFAELGRKLATIKDNHQHETRIILGAEDDVAYDVLIKAMDSARGTAERRLFPDVTLTRGAV